MDSLFGDRHAAHAMLLDGARDKAGSLHIFREIPQVFRGRGTAFNALLGVLILAVIGNIMNLKNVPGYHQEVVKGVIILVAVLFQSGIWTRRR